MYSKIGNNKIVLTLIIALFGMALLFLMTPYGVGLSPDSVAYIQGSQSIVKTGSLHGLSAHWPPGYPVLLALLSLPQGDYLAAARCVGVALFGLNLLLLNVLLQKNGWHVLYAGLLTILLIFDPEFLYAHLMAWSEPTFLALVLGSMLALLAYAESDSRRYVWLAGLAIGMATLVRYAGMAFIGGIAFLFLLDAFSKKREQGMKAGLIPLAQFLLISLAPIALWVVSRSERGKQNGIRSLLYHPVTQQKWNEAATMLSKWFGGLGIGALMLCILTIVVVTGWKNMSVYAKRALSISAILLLSYVTFILVSLVFFDANIPLDDRIFFPVKILTYLLIFIALGTFPSKWRLLATALFFVSVVALNYSQARFIMSTSSLHGFGFAQVEVRNQPILAFIKANHIEIDATNSPELTSLYLNQQVASLPPAYDPTTRVPFAGQAEALTKLAQPHNTVVIFSAMLWRDYLPNPRQMVQAGFTSVVYQQPDGIILQHP